MLFKDEDEYKLSSNSQEYQLKEHSQDDELTPSQLSGDQNESKNTIITVTMNANTQSKANAFLSMLTIVKTVIGAGILSLPYVLKSMGVVLALVMFGLCFALTNFTGRILLNAKNLSAHSNYTSIMYFIHKKKFARIIIYVIFVFTPVGSSLVDLLLLKSTIRKIFVDVILDRQVLDSYYTSEQMIILVVAVLLFPLMLFQKIQRLRFCAFLGVLGISIYILTFIVYFINQDIDYPGSLHTPSLFPSNWFKAISTIPSIIFSSTFQTNFYPVFKGLQKSSDSRMKWVVFGASLICTVSFLLTGFLGYILGGETVQPNYLQSIKYQTSNKFIFFLMNSGFLVSLFFSIPIILFAARNNFIGIMNQLFQSGQKLKKSTTKTDSIEIISSFIGDHNAATRSKKAKILFLLYTFVMFTILIVISYFVDNLASVLNLVGAIGCASVSIICPVYFYKNIIEIMNKLKTWKYYLSAGIFYFMLPFTLFSIAALYIPNQ